MEENRLVHVLKKRKMLLVSIWLIFVYWTLESLIHVFVFNHGTFGQQFLFPVPHEIWMRSIVILILLIFGFYADFMVGIHRRAEERIRHAHSELNQIFNTAADGMRLIDKDFNVLKVNDTFSRMVRISRDEAVNKKCYEVFRGSLCHTTYCPLRRILNGEEYVEVDSVKERKDGSSISCIVTATPFRDSKGELIGIVEHFRDVTDRKRAQDRLKKSEERYRMLVENAPIGIISVDVNGNIIDINPKLVEIMGPPSAEETSSINVLEFPNLIESGISEDFKKCIETGEEVVAEKLYTPKWGKKMILRYILTPTYDSGGRMSGVQAIVEDITERKLAENALKESEERWKALYKHIPVPVYIWRKDRSSFTLVGCNDAAYSITRGKVQELMGRRADEIYRERPDILEDLRKCYEERRIIKKEMDYFYTTENRTMHFIVGYAFAPPDLVIVYTQDITEMKEIQEKLQNSLNEKEALLKEVHHRVKNNLQIISSLLNLQKAYIRDGETRNFLNDSQNRIRTMALIHERLYRSKDIVGIDFSEYVKSLVSYLVRSCDLSQGIKTVVNIDNVYLNIDTAIPCGLIINELVTNSIKHAFSEGAGEIRVEMRSSNGKMRLFVSDNGRGLPHEIDFKNTETLGLQLVNTLVNQLDGDIKVYRENGTKFEISFEVK